MIRRRLSCSVLALLLTLGLGTPALSADDGLAILAQARHERRFGDAKEELLSRLEHSTDSQSRISLKIALANVELENGQVGAARDLAAAILADEDIAPHERARTQETLGRIYIALGDFLAIGEAARDGLAQPVNWKADIARRRLHAALTFLLATEAQATGRYDEAGALHEQALAERRAIPDLPPDELLSSLNGLATLHYQRGRVDAAWPLMVEVAEAAREHLPPGAPTRLTTQQNVLTIALNTGRLEAAENALNLIETDCAATPAPFCTLGVMDFMKGGTLTRLGRHSEAEQAYARAISLAEAADSPNVSLLAQALNNLALTLKGRGAVVEAADAFGRALSLHVAGTGALNETSLKILGNRANALILANQPALAEAELRTVIALANEEKQVPPPLGVLHARLAAALDAQGRWDEALDTADLAVALTSTGSDRMHAHAARAQILSHLDRHTDALADQNVVLEQARRQKAPADPELAYPLVATARLLLKIGENVQALDNLTEASSILPAWLVAQRPPSPPNEVGALTWAGLRDAVAELQLETLWRLRELGGDEAVLNERAFEAAQQRLSGSSGDAMALAAARGLSNQPGILAEKIQAWENARHSLVQADQIWSRLLGDSKIVAGRREAALLNRQSAEARLDAADDALAKASDRFSTTREPRNVSLSELRASLRGDEAVMTFIIAEEALHVFTVTRETSSWRREAVSAELLCEEVRALRLAIDADRVLICSGANPPAPSDTNKPREDHPSPPSIDNALHRGLETTYGHLDRVRAYQLWLRLMAPEHTLLGNRKLIISAHGALASLPFNLLVTEAPSGNDADPEALRQTAWLLHGHAISAIPEPRLIPLLRARPHYSAEGFLGVGAPIGSLAPALPGAEQELRAMANRAAVTAPHAPVTLLTGAQATKSRLQSLGLIERRVVVFATHGLTPGELGGDDYALLMSPEEYGAEDASAILTASEIAGSLSLHVDWVVLSACNTVTLHGTGDAHGGLARAFFATGARNLLLSHAPVRDDVAARMTEAVVASTTGQAEALRQAAWALMTDETQPELAHPRHWANFMVLGIDSLDRPLDH